MQYMLYPSHANTQHLLDRAELTPNSTWASAPPFPPVSIENLAVGSAQWIQPSNHNHMLRSYGASTIQWCTPHSFSRCSSKRSTALDRLSTQIPGARAQIGSCANCPGRAPSHCTSRAVTNTPYSSWCCVLICRYRMYSVLRTWSRYSCTSDNLAMIVKPPERVRPMPRACSPHPLNFHGRRVQNSNQTRRRSPPWTGWMAETSSTLGTGLDHDRLTCLSLYAMSRGRTTHSTYKCVHGEFIHSVGRQAITISITITISP